MNSNFWFNYEKKQEEMKSKPLVEKLEDNMEEDIITSKNDNKKDDKSNKKRSAFIKLMVGIIFIIVIMIVLSLGSNGNIIKEETDNDTNHNVNNEKDSTDIKDIVLNGDYKFEYLKYTNSLGTDLKVYLPLNHVWKTGFGSHGEICNLPTEEIFTSPDYKKTEGIVYSSKPLYYNNVLIDNFSLTFKDGKVVDHHADHGENLLKSIKL